MEYLLILVVLVAGVLVLSRLLRRAGMRRVTLNYLIPDEDDEPLTPCFCPVAGINKEALSGAHRQDIIAKLKEGEPIFLVREPNNPHDPNAVALFTEGDRDIGYLPRDWAAEIAERLDAGSPVTAKVAAVEPFETEQGLSLLGVRLEVTKYRKRRQKPDP